ncbi:MAG: acyl-CoA dehydrogenase [Gammaproteobacteria bacterium]|nr:acyl-CoA dehydrogenase [Gammaproteobacteria bacterium]
MPALVTALIVFGVAVALAYRAASLRQWLLVFGATLVLLATRVHGFALLIVLLAAGGWLALAALGVPSNRRRFVTGPALALLRRALPKISQTEREALEAGTVWWDAELFSGQPRWQRLLGLPAPRLSAAEQAFLDGPVERLCRMVDDWQVNQELRDLPADVWQFLRREGFFGIIIPTAYGGLGFSPLAHSQIVMKISTRCGTAAVTVMVPNSLGPAELLLRSGTEAQKQHYLPRLARGEEIPCFALTNPHAGSDAASIPDSGVVCRGEHAGERVLGMRVTFDKRYITLAPVATLVGLAFRLRDPDGLLGADPEVGITLALLPATHPGVEIGRRHWPAGQAFQNGPVRGTDVFIPMSMVIGGQERCGQGWRMLMNCLAAGRSISLPATATGALKFVARTTGAYARIRTQFKLPIGRMEGVEEPLARIAADAYAVDAARTVTACVLAADEEPSVLSALLKYQATERMRRAIDDALDVHGGRGVICGPTNYLFSAYQSVPVAITVEGANILTRTLIVFGQGAIRCHPWLLKEIEAAQVSDETAALAAFDAAFAGHVRHAAMLFARALVLSLTGARFTRAPVHGATARWFRQIDRASAAFALVAEVALLVLGGALKRREKISGRFADVLGELYLASCALKRYEDDGRPGADRPLVDAVCANALATIDARLDAVLANFPVPVLGRVLRLIVLPWGPHRPADDALGHALAALLLEPSPTRDRLTAGMDLSMDPDDVVGRLEHTLALVIQAEPIERRIHAAVRAGRLDADPDPGTAAVAAVAAGIIDAGEQALLAQTRAAVARVIAVDEFAAGELEALPRVGADDGGQPDLRDGTNA